MRTYLLVYLGLLGFATVARFLSDDLDELSDRIAVLLVLALTAEALYCAAML